MAFLKFLPSIIAVLSSVLSVSVPDIQAWLAQHPDLAISLSSLLAVIANFTKPPAQVSVRKDG